MTIGQMEQVQAWANEIMNEHVRKIDLTLRQRMKWTLVQQWDQYAWHEQVMSLKFKYRDLP